MCIRDSKDRDVVFARITKYYPSDGDVQDWGALSYLRFLGSINRALVVSRFLMSIGLIKLDDGSVKTPYTNADGESKEFYQNYVEIVNSIADLEKDV